MAKLTTLTRKELVEAAEDLNVILKLNPLIATAFESTLKGAALKSVEGKFLAQVKADLIECATLIRETDTLQESTVNVLETIGVEGIRQKVKTVAQEESPEESPDTVGAPGEKVVEKKEEEKTETTSASYRSCPTSGRKIPEAACQKKIKEGICEEEDGKCHIKGKKHQPHPRQEKREAEAKAKVKAPVKAKKAPAQKKAIKTTSDIVERDKFGFRKGSHVAEAISMLASGKPLKDVRKKFNRILSFSELLKTLEHRGLKMKENKKGVSAIVRLSELLLKGRK